ncbi:MAG TPA: 2-oxoglutarate and iron-dependent oxygenase domain-containing protein [Kineosporiaceae bacterium]
MTLTAFDRIPIVDIGPLLYGPREAHPVIADQLREAATEIGFLHVTGCAPPVGVFDRMLAATKKFFDLPEAVKLRSYIGLSTCHRGYVPESEEVLAGGTPDRKEAFDVSVDLPADDPDHLVGVPVLGPNTWPDVPGFREAVTAYYDHTITVARAMFRGFALALGEESDFFEPYLTKPPSQLRLLHYPADPDTADRPGNSAHTDDECFTLLRSTGPGLEVLDARGVWVDAPPVPGAYAVTIGDLLQRWSNGEFIATTHRVRAFTTEHWAFPLFCTVDYHTQVEPLTRFVAPDRQQLPGVVAGEHLFARTAQTFRYLRRRSPADPTAVASDATR